MRIIKKKIGEYAELTGYLHELNDETDNIKEYPAILIFPGVGWNLIHGVKYHKQELRQQDKSEFPGKRASLMVILHVISPKLYF